MRRLSSRIPSPLSAIFYSTTLLWCLILAHTCTKSTCSPSHSSPHSTISSLPIVPCLDVPVLVFLNPLPSPLKPFLPRISCTLILVVLVDIVHGEVARVGWPAPSRPDLFRGQKECSPGVSNKLRFGSRKFAPRTKSEPKAPGISPHKLGNCRHLTSHHQHPLIRCTAYGTQNTKSKRCLLPASDRHPYQQALNTASP